MRPQFSTPLIAGGAALVIALGGGTLFATRRARKS
ncbi:LAETG motif-containing sortase-dependent surface protein [Streptomyces sp. Ag109_O5-10]|nr:LAETG motif-containing sortase-dependent surface protein [Streptomyces sp. Ag109_O5-10]